MDTVETIGSPKSCDVNSEHQIDTQSVSLRRLKKREVDRRCQREARERKRSRIASLESLVVDLRRQDASGQVAALLEQLKRVEEERNLATKTLKDIQKLMFQRLSKPGTDLPQGNATVEFQWISGGTKTGTDSARSPSGEYGLPALPNAQPALLNIEAIPASLPAPANFIAMASTGEFEPSIAHSSIATSKQNISRLTNQALVQSTNTSRQHTTKSSRIYDWVNPQSSCCCHAHLDRQPGQPALWQGSFWKFICDVLSERFDWAESVQPADDAESEDVLVRAMVEGWGNVADCGRLHPSLQMLRRIDEATFRPIAKIERLAMLRAMHLLLQFHSQPSAERYNRLPPWYLYRPSQHVPHTYAIDYWAWPPFRQRFISNEDTYCGNDFFFMYQSQLRLLWPFEFRDCYTHDLETGLYKPSRLFDERINDIKCWTMGNDFFERFPELSSDIPVAVGQVPKLLCSGIRQMNKRSSSPASTTLNRDIQSSRGMVVDEGELRPQESQGECPDERAEALGDASSLTLSSYGQLFEPHLSQSPDEQSYALPLPLHGYHFQGPTVYHSFSTSHGFYNTGDFDFDTESVQPTTGDASAFPFTPGAAVCGSAGSTDLSGYLNMFSIV